ncbi:MAG TPA: sulfurtransferase [Vicinamibacteria bacterium]|nr:sulfurtransferase [Vicinamibacteria bacterium]
MPDPPPLVTTDWLFDHLGDALVRVADVRWYLDPARRGREAYEAGRIPGAVFLDVDLDLSAPGGGRGRPSGRHPWPGADQMARVMGAAGIGPRTRVVAYDDQAGAVAARLWYLLRAYGHDAVAVLDGGIAKWKAEGRPLESGPAAPPVPARFVPRPREGWVLSKEAMAREAGGALVLDARSAERFRGDAEPIDPRAGHIPGARNAPYAGNLTPGDQPVFRPPSELRDRYEALGAGDREPIVYCGSGVTACHVLLALDLAGRRGRLYPGSWSEWSADPGLPVATGAET